MKIKKITYEEASLSMEVDYLHKRTQILYQMASISLKIDIFQFHMLKNKNKSKKNIKIYKNIKKTNKKQENQNKENKIGGEDISPSIGSTKS